jgi:hypothetical protein
MVDAASWNWNLVGDYWYDEHPLIDWQHATEQLGLVTTLASSQGTPQAQKWFKQQGTILLQGHADQVTYKIFDLVEDNLAQCQEIRSRAEYYKNHQHRLNKLEIRSEGWVIGIGMLKVAENASIIASPK